MNTKRRAVEIRNSEHTPDIGYLQKAADYMKAREKTWRCLCRGLHVGL